MCFFFSSCFLFGLYSSTFPSSCCVVSAGCGNQRMEGGKLSNLSIPNNNVQYFCLHICQIFLFLLFFIRNEINELSSVLVIFNQNLKWGLLSWSPEATHKSPWEHFVENWKCEPLHLPRKWNHILNTGGGSPTYQTQTGEFMLEVME